MADPVAGTSPDRPTVVMVGHFPPPVHGMAVAFAALADEFATRSRVVRISTSPAGLRRTPRYHAQRVMRWVVALAKLVRNRGTSDRVVFSVDAGLGMWYLIVGVTLARMLGYRSWLQHHSYAYLAQDMRPMRILARVSDGAVHLCSCHAMTHDLRSRYPRIRNAETLPLAYAVSRAGAGTERSEATHLRIGHFGNLTLDKGLATAVDTLEAALRDGIDAELRLAGPVCGAEEDAYLRSVLERHRDRIKYFGPVYDAARDQFLADLDVLLFPSRYPHESFGLALWECLSHGTPAIAYRAGCLSQAAVGTAALVINPSTPFVPAAVAYLHKLERERDGRVLMRSATREHAESVVAAGRGAAQEFVARVCVD